MKYLVKKVIFCFSFLCLVGQFFVAIADDGWIDVVVVHNSALDADGNSCARYTAIFSANFVSHTSGARSVPQSRCLKDGIAFYKVMFSDLDGRVKYVSSSDLDNRSWIPR